MKLDDNFALADLFCRRYNAHNSQENPLYFILRRDFANTFEKYPRYHLQAVSYLNTQGRPSHSRLVTPNDGVSRGIDLANWEDIYISVHPEYLSDLAVDSRSLTTQLVDTLSPHFQILPSTISNLMHHANLYLSAVTETPVPWTGLSPMTLRFIYPRIRSLGQILITIGRCTGDSGRDPATKEATVFPSTPHYAFADFYGATLVHHEVRPATSHKCPEDHVTNGSTRIFHDKRFGQLTLSFSRSSAETREETLQLRVDFEVSCCSLLDS